MVSTLFEALRRIQDQHGTFVAPCQQDLPEIDQQDPPADRPQAASAGLANRLAPSASPDGAATSSTELTEAKPAGSGTKSSRHSMLAENGLIAGRPASTESTAKLDAISQQLCRKKQPVLQLPVEDTYRNAATILAGQLRHRHSMVMVLDYACGRLGANWMAKFVWALQSQSGRKILLVDASVDGALAAQFGVWSEKGLGDVMLGLAKLNDVIHYTFCNDLSVLPPGRTWSIVSTAAIDISPPLQQVRTDFSLLLVSCPFSQRFLWLEALAAWCDCVVAAVPLGMIGRREVAQDMRMIRSWRPGNVFCLAIDCFGSTHAGHAGSTTSGGQSPGNS